MKRNLLAAMALLTLTSPLSVADENPSHFPALPSPDMRSAWCNLSDYNDKLQALLKQSQLSTEDMVKVHELTYTLENAIARLKTELDDMAADLEQVHLASERLDHQVVQTKGVLFVEDTQMLDAGCVALTAKTQ